MKDWFWLAAGGLLALISISAPQGSPERGVWRLGAAACFVGALAFHAGV